MLSHFLKQLGIMLLRQEEILHLLGTIFHRGLIHTGIPKEYYLRDYYVQQDCVYNTKSELSTAPRFMVFKEHPVQQCVSLAQRNKLSKKYNVANKRFVENTQHSGP